MNLTGKPVLVTGGTGFIGSVTVAARIIKRSLTVAARIIKRILIPMSIGTTRIVMHLANCETLP
jgi:nucleoside-diphosphate-sugar epimerase